jgi:membrane AbrB-like protein
MANTRALVDVARDAGGIAVGAAGGALCAWIGTPIPWLLGPLFAVALVNLAGVPIRCPSGGRELGQIFIGTVIGLYFTTTVAVIVATHLPWMALVAIVSLALGALGAWIQQRIAKLDLATAFFGCVPGGMSEMFALGDRFRAEPVALALSQLIRVTIVVCTVPAALTYLGHHGDEIFQPVTRAVDWRLLPVLLLGAAGVAFGLNRLGMTNAWMLGAIAFSAALTVSGVELSAVPQPVTIIGQVLIGVSVGQRFEREALAGAPRVILGAAIATVLMMIVSVALSFLIARATGISVWSIIAATAPGGLAEMSVTAQVLHLGVPLVTAYHIVRIFMITLITLPMFRLLLRFGSQPAE